jgi:hypothetical protein
MSPTADKALGFSCVADLYAFFFAQLVTGVPNLEVNDTTKMIKEQEHINKRYQKL